MLGKLLKDELKSYRFSLGITFLAGLVFTVFMKIFCMLPYDDGIREMMQILGAYAYYYVIMLIGTAAQVLIIVRFYTTMVADRGYLTWTLPVKPSTHIWAKLIGGIIWKMIANIVITLLLGVFYIGNYWELDWRELVEEIWASIPDIMDLFKLQYLPAIFLTLLAILLWSVTSILMLYMCIAIGQLFGKWRIIASIGAYFVMMMIIYALAMAGIIFLSVGFLPFAEWLDSIIGEIELNVTVVVTCVIAVFAAVGGGLDALFFGITNRIFKKHLNLE